VECVNVCRLCQKKNAEKKLAVTVFSFPPDKGNVGTAAYLNVFGSIYKVLESLRREGYNVGELPANGEELIQTVCPITPSPPPFSLFANLYGWKEDEGIHLGRTGTIKSDDHSLWSITFGAAIRHVLCSIGTVSFIRFFGKHKRSRRSEKRVGLL